MRVWPTMDQNESTDNGTWVYTDNIHSLGQMPDAREKEIQYMWFDYLDL